MDLGSAPIPPSIRPPAIGLSARQTQPAAQHLMISVLTPWAQRVRWSLSYRTSFIYPKFAIALQHSINSFFVRTSISFDLRDSDHVDGWLCHIPSLWNSIPQDREASVYTVTLAWLMQRLALKTLRGVLHSAYLFCARWPCGYKYLPCEPILLT